jgi:predicted Zn-dependent protease with MMP-like domain/uncharacterized protein (DUF952 family)
MTDPIAYHLVPAEIWSAAPPDEPFRAASLETEGFIHLTHWMVDLVEVANSLYRDDPRPHVVLTVELRRLTSTWRYDGDTRYPHVYGPLDRASITAVRPIMRASDGTFLPLERSDHGTPPDNGQAALDALFDQVITRTLATLPDAFVERLGSVAIVVDDEASPEQLASVGARGLYGIYQGVPRTRWGAENVPIASKITLFRGPLVRSQRTQAGLERAVEDTLLHEIAHHFGIDDHRLRELQRR